MFAFCKKSTKIADASSKCMMVSWTFRCSAKTIFLCVYGCFFFHMDVSIYLISFSFLLPQSGQALKGRQKSVLIFLTGARAWIDVRLLLSMSIFFLSFYFS
jgi:hypothetical protein